MAGTGAVDITSRSIFRNTRARLPWLLASFAGGLLAVYVIGIFESQLKDISALAAFIPIIMGMGGNIRTQPSTIIVRNRSEKLGLRIPGGCCGVNSAQGLYFGTAYGLLWRFREPCPPLPRTCAETTACRCALAIFVNMIIGATVGTLIPMVFSRIHIDPAVATGPFVTTAIDAAGIFTYFLVAKTFLFSGLTEGWGNGYRTENQGYLAR